MVQRNLINGMTSHKWDSGSLARASIMQSALHTVASPSVTWVNQLKTIEVRIMQISPHSSPIVSAA